MLGASTLGAGTLGAGTLGAGTLGADTLGAGVVGADALMGVTCVVVGAGCAVPDGADNGSDSVLAFRCIIG